MITDRGTVVAAAVSIRAVRLPFRKAPKISGGKKLQNKESKTTEITVEIIQSEARDFYAGFVERWDWNE